MFAWKYYSLNDQNRRSRRWAWVCMYLPLGFDLILFSGAITLHNLITLQSPSSKCSPDNCFHDFISAKQSRLKIKLIGIVVAIAS